MQKEVLKRNLQGFLNVFDDNEELYLKRANETSEFYDYIHSITKGNSRELSQYFEGDLNGIQFIERRGESCSLVRNYFSYYPSRYPALLLDTNKAFHKSFETMDKSKARAKEEIERASGLMTYVPYKNAWQPIICIIPNKENEKRMNDTLAHELIHVCRTPIMLKHSDFYANGQPLNPIPFFKAEVYAFIVGINGIVADSLSEGKDISKNQRRKLCSAIAGNASKYEIEKIIGYCAEAKEYPLESACRNLPSLLNMGYNSPNIMRTLFGWWGMAAGAASFNPFLWWFSAMNAMNGMNELQTAFSSMEKEIDIFFKARSTLKKSFGNNSAKAIVGRASIEELEEICSVGENRLNDWMHSKNNFRWQLIKSSARL